MVNLIYSVPISISPSSTSYLVMTTTLPTGTSSPRSGSDGGPHVSVTLLALVLVGAGLLIMCLGAWSRWVYLTRQRVQMEQRMLERSERDAARRARRAKLEALVEPELHEAELGVDQGDKIAGLWRDEDGGKLPLALAVRPKTSSVTSQISSSGLSPHQTDTLFLSVLILPPTPPIVPALDDASAPSASYDGEDEPEIPEVYLGTTPVILSHVLPSSQEEWAEVVQSLQPAKKTRSAAAAPIASIATPMDGPAGQTEMRRNRGPLSRSWWSSQI